MDLLDLVWAWRLLIRCLHEMVNRVCWPNWSQLPGPHFDREDSSRQEHSSTNTVSNLSPSLPTGHKEFVLFQEHVMKIWYTNDSIVNLCTVGAVNWLHAYVSVVCSGYTLAYKKHFFMDLCMKTDTPDSSALFCSSSTWGLIYWWLQVRQWWDCRWIQETRILVI